jgi:hypothetical protein
MPLTFDDRRLLSPGIHDATLAEIEQELALSNRRRTLFNHLTEYVRGVRLTGWACEVLVDGSFVMPPVVEPDDVDVLLVLPAGWDLTRRDFRGVRVRRPRQDAHEAGPQDRGLSAAARFRRLSVLLRSVHPDPHRVVQAIPLAGGRTQGHREGRAMIANDNELRITRERLALAEAALDACRRDFLPHNEVQYRLFAGSTVDLILSIRADIDAYLGIGPDPDLAISLEGQSVALGQTSASIVSRSIDTFRRGLQSVAAVLHADRQSDGVPGRAAWIERLCELSLVGVGPGSVQVFLDLSATADRLFAEEDRRFLDDTLTTLFDGLEWAAREGEAVPPSLERLSPSTRLSVLGVVSRLLPPQTGPVEQITYRRRSAGPARPPCRAALTRQSRQRVHREMERLAADRRFTVAEGVIRQIDLDAQTFILRERPEGQADLPCAYPASLEETAKELLDRRVHVAGLLETSRSSQRSKMGAEAIEPIGGEVEEVEQPGDAARPREQRSEQRS